MFNRRQAGRGFQSIVKSTEVSGISENMKGSESIGIKKEIFIPNVYVDRMFVDYCGVIRDYQNLPDWAKRSIIEVGKDVENTLRRRGYIVRRLETPVEPAP